MSIIGCTESGGDGLWNLDSQGAVTSSAAVQVNGGLRVTEMSTLDGGASASSLFVLSTLSTGALSVAGTSWLGTAQAVSLDLTGDMSASGLVSVNSNGLDSGVGRGLRFWSPGSSQYAMYMAQAGAGKSAAGVRQWLEGWPAPPQRSVRM